MKTKNITQLRKNAQLTSLALPAIIILLIFSYIPMSGLIIAFKNVNYVDGIFKSPWVGLDNIKFFFTSNDMFMVTRNTILYNLSFIIIGTFFSVIFAVLLNEVLSRRAVKLYQTVFFFPYFFSWVVVGYMVYAFMASPFGILVTELKKFGIDLNDFYYNTTYWPVFLVLLGIWKSLGYTSIIFYAGIMGLPRDYYEAAEIDGASKFQAITKITIPLLTPLITIMVLLSVGRIFSSDFGLFWFIPREIGQLYPVTQVIDTYVYRMLRVTSDLGMASASGLYQSLVGFTLLLVSNFIVGKISDENRAF